MIIPWCDVLCSHHQRNEHSTARLAQVLFATETFSTGLNMPAKTVVFTNARKFDGGGFRWLTSGEYIQMSGRAGRRGIDDRGGLLAHSHDSVLWLPCASLHWAGASLIGKRAYWSCAVQHLFIFVQNAVSMSVTRVLLGAGVVILCLDTRMEPAVARGMVQGAPDTLHSEFQLSYTMLLNLLLGEAALGPEALLQASFRQFQTERALPALRARIARLEVRRAPLPPSMPFGIIKA